MSLAGEVTPVLQRRHSHQGHDGGGDLPASFSACPAPWMAPRACGCHGNSRAPDPVRTGY